MRTVVWALATALLLTAAPTWAASTITIINVDGAGEGLNDTTARSPVGGNSGTTLGQQRLIAVQHAASRWAGILNSSVEIRMRVSFDPLACSPDGAVGAIANPLTASFNFTNRPVANTLYAAALANALAGTDLNGSDDLQIQVNSSIDQGCLGSISGLYYGLDFDPPSGTLDPHNIFWHEMAHGLGFTTFVNPSTGAKANGLDDAYMRFLEDHSTGMLFPAMTDAQRVSAAIDTGDLHWTGSNVVGAAGFLTGGRHSSGHVEMNAPNPVQPASSMVHFSTTLAPDELMEPSLTLDPEMTLTIELFRDLGWPLAPRCGNGFQQSGEQCDDGNTSNGDCCTSTCTLVANGTVCRAIAGSCDITETCDGVSWYCPADVFRASGIACRNAADVCDVTETCTGSSPTCPSNQFLSSGVCRAAAGVCDLAESCDGSGAACPPDLKSSAICRASAAACDIPEVCDGVTNNCPANAVRPSTFVCRPAATNCDAAEYCNGSSTACPADAVQPSTVVCRPAATNCDVEERCNGSSNICPADAVQPSTVVCRPAATSCDVAEKCNGSTTVCPADAVQPSTQVCRAAASVCDIEERCDGSTSVCPADSVQPSTHVCRAAATACDLEERCNGSTTVCPADSVQPSTFVCRAAASACDAEERCNGSSNTCPADAFQPSTVVCRTAADACDTAEKCTGSSPTCPTDVTAPNGSPCDSGDGCPADTCQSGMCSAVSCPDVDAVVLAPPPKSYKIAAGSAQIVKSIAVLVRNPEASARVIELTVDDSGCPAGMVSQPDFDSTTPVADSSILVPPGGTKKAKLTLTLQSSEFATFNAKAPTRCALRFAAQAVVSGGSNEISPSNNQAWMEINIKDKNDAEQTATHESFINSARPSTLNIADTKATTGKTLKAVIGNADYKPVAENPGDSIELTATTTCTGVSLSTPICDTTTSSSSATLKGGATRTCKLTATANAAQISTPNKRAPQRCTVVLSAVGAAESAPLDPSNNTTELPLDVLDKNDY